VVYRGIPCQASHRICTPTNESAQMKIPVEQQSKDCCESHPCFSRSRALPGYARCKCLHLEPCSVTGITLRIKKLTGTATLFKQYDPKNDNKKSETRTQKQELTKNSRNSGSCGLVSSNYGLTTEWLNDFGRTRNISVVEPSFILP